MTDETENGAGGETPPPSRSAVNDQVIDSVSALAALAAGHGPTSAASMLSLVAAETVALGLYNAVARQQADATISSAAVAAICARMLGTNPSPDAAETSLPGLAAAAEAQAQAGIRILTTLVAQTGSESEAAGSALTRIAAAAAAPKPGS